MNTPPRKSPSKYRQAVKDAHERVERLTEALRVQSAHWRMRPIVEALMCLRGFDFSPPSPSLPRSATYTASRITRVDGVSGTGPSEYSSGDTRHQGRITKAGKTHAWRILVEAAWNYRFKPQVRRSSRCASKTSQIVRDIAWRAHLRLTSASHA